MPVYGSVHRLLLSGLALSKSTIRTMASTVVGDAPVFSVSYVKYVLSTDWLIDWLIDWSIDWLIDWLIVIYIEKYRWVYFLGHCSKWYHCQIHCQVRREGFFPVENCKAINTSEVFFPEAWLNGNLPHASILYRASLQFTLGRCEIWTTLRFTSDLLFLFFVYNTIMLCLPFQNETQEDSEVLMVGVC